MATYEAPTVEVIGTLEELTQVVPKGGARQVDGYKLHVLRIS